MARAIHHAHSQGILHRDLKPGNILLDNSDQPRVADFGLAKQLSTEAGQTRTGAVLGTPSYMAPEQAIGRKDLGPACDIYGLGALLYELISGRPPFQAETPIDTLMQVIDREPAPPRLLNPSIDRDLETICLKCLAKNPKERYASAEELSEDLERYLNSEPIRARSLNVMDRLARTLGRDQIGGEFHSYANMLALFAVVILIESVAMFGLLYAEADRKWVSLARLAQFPVLVLIFIRFHGHKLLPRSPSERNLWSIWLGYFIACSVVIAVDRQLVHHDLKVYYGALYAHQTIAAGLAFFIMGGVFWGRFYALGATFFILAMLMPWWPEAAPLIFGSAWTVALGLIARHLNRLSKEAGEDGKTGKTSVLPTRPAIPPAPVATQKK